MSMGHTITQDDLNWYLVLSGANFFALGYGIAALWKLLRQLFSSFPPIDPDPYSRTASQNKRPNKSEMAKPKNLTDEI